MKRCLAIVAFLAVLQLTSLSISAAAGSTCDGRPATVQGTDGADTIDGTGGNDVILGLGGDDVIRGLGGSDVICGDTGNDVLRGGPGSDTLIGGDGDDVLRCGAGHDGWITGDEGNDALYGERSGSNDLIPGPGDDLIVGSDTGPDWLHFQDATGPIVASMVLGTATGQGSDTFRDIDALYGSPYDDTLIGDDRDVAGVVQGLVGRAGDDTLLGNGGPDYLSGQQGDDAMDGGAGFDVAEYYDQEHGDEIDYGPMNVNLRTGIATGDGTDTLTGIEGATGSDGPDVMVGDDGPNSFFWLFGGNDTVAAGAGNDYVAPGAGTNIVDGGLGTDTLSMLGGKLFHDRHGGVTVDLASGTTSAGDTLTGFENVFGSVGDDVLIGASGSNTLFGYSGDDVLLGRDGNDKLIGQGGRDRANGGLGNDRCGAEESVACESTWVSVRRTRSGEVTHFD